MCTSCSRPCLCLQFLSDNSRDFTFWLFLTSPPCIYTDKFPFAPVILTSYASMCDIGSQPLPWGDIWILCCLWWEVRKWAEAVDDILCKMPAAGFHCWTVGSISITQKVSIFCLSLAFFPTLIGMLFKLLLFEGHVLNSPLQKDWLTAWNSSWRWLPHYSW